MESETELTKALVLEIKVPGWYVEDLEERGKDFDVGVEYIVTEEMMRPEVGLTVVTLPGEKCMNSDYEVVAATGQIIGARVVDAQ
jgi:hypothetical protein